jgi:hypothetical protein
MRTVGGGYLALGTTFDTLLLSPLDSRTSIRESWDLVSLSICLGTRVLATASMTLCLSEDELLCIK